MITINCPCGEVYRAEERHEGKNIKCRNCGTVLPISKLTAPPPAKRTAEILQERREPAYNGPQKSSTPPRKNGDGGKRSRKKSYMWIGAAAVWGIILLYLVFSEHKPPMKSSLSSPPSPVQTSPPTSIEMPQKVDPPLPITPIEPIKAKQYKPIELIEPKNPKRLPLGSSPLGIGIFSGHSTLTVDNGTDADAVVKAIRLRDREQHVRNFFVHQRDKWTAQQIPPGRYVLRVAFGRDWNSQSRKFNFRRTFSETEPFEITETTAVRQTEDGQLTETQFTKMRITLHKVLHGNFKSHEINEEDFDR